MNLLIDIGNTSAKLAVAESNMSGGVLQLLHSEHRHEPWSDTLKRIASAYPISSVRVSSVAADDPSLHQALSEMECPVMWLTSHTPCPIKDAPLPPEGYGADRWAADIGAMMMAPDNTLLVIDAGTCITYDVVAADGHIVGGVISPGVQLRLKAMHEHTALLPLFEAESEAPLVGNDTHAAMMSAAVNGTRFEMEGYINRLHQLYDDLHVFITGGNEFELGETVVCPVSHVQNLVLVGLNAL